MLLVRLLYPIRQSLLRSSETISHLLYLYVNIKINGNALKAIVITKIATQTILVHIYLI